MAESKNKNIKAKLSLIGLRRKCAKNADAFMKQLDEAQLDRILIKCMSEFSCETKLKVLHDHIVESGYGVYDLRKKTGLNIGSPMEKGTDRPTEMFPVCPGAECWCEACSMVQTSDWRNDREVHKKKAAEYAEKAFARFDSDVETLSKLS